MLHVPARPMSPGVSNILQYSVTVRNGPTVLYEIILLGPANAYGVNRWLSSDYIYKIGVTLNSSK